MRSGKSRVGGTGKLMLLLGAGAAAVALYRPLQSMWRQGTESLRDMVRRLLEQQLSSRLGARVHFGQLRISLNGTMHAEDLSIIREGSSEPFLTAARMHGEVSPAKALAGQLLITQMTLEQPVITIVREADGSTNLPRAVPRDLDEATEQAHRLAETAEQAAHAAEQARDMGLGLQIGKAVLINGQFHYRDEKLGGYHLSAEQIYGEVRRVMDGYDIMGTIQSVGRRDEPATLGPIGINGQLVDVVNLFRIDRGSLWANMDIGEDLCARLEIDSLRTCEGRLNAEGSTDLRGLGQLLPDHVPALRPIKQSGVEGEVNLNLRAEYAPADGLRIHEMNFGARDVTIGGEPENP